MSAPKLVYGGGVFTKEYGYGSPEKVKELLDALEEHGIKAIDTAVVYGESEVYLGEAKAPSRFIIDTKLPGGLNPVPSTKDVVVAQGKESLKKLQTQQVDILYMHSPDTRPDLKDTLAGINELYNLGAFKRFGLSNYDAKQVEDVIRVCKEHNYVLPTVYQGNYNAVARRAETELIPLLREHGIAFYAYSPIAGGFLAKKAADFRDNTLTARWNPDTFLGKIYRAMYNQPDLVDALDRWNGIAADEGISAVELAFRWAVHNSILEASLGDAVIIGPKTVEQLQGVMAAIRKGPLSQEVQDKIDVLWAPLKEGSYMNNLEVFGKIMQGQ